MAAVTLNRKHFETSRLLDFFSQKELIAQTGHQVSEWPLVLIKELFDNALDACEEAGIQPEISVDVTPAGIRISDNGPGIPQSVIESVLDFSVRVSSREAYVSPSRGAQGNALKTIVAMPFVLMGSGGVPLFIVHDFDKSGFEIAECLTEVSDWAVDNDRVAYPFENEINFVDFGLRLDDAKKYKLNSERVKKKVTIKSSYVTDEERAFLESQRRIELNAFTAPQFIEWLESKLVEQLGKKRLIPDDETLAKAYQRATLIARINSAIEQLQEEFSDVDCEVEQLRRLVHDQMSKPVFDGGETTWDRALYQIAKQHDKGRKAKH